jgi:hypothetical protein
VSLAGVVLSGRIAARVAIIGRSVLQRLMGGVGMMMVALGIKLRRDRGARA